MALTLPVAGDTYTLTVDHGVGAGALAAGTAIEVIEVVPPGTPGVGHSEGEDVVVFAAWEPSLVIEDGHEVDGIAFRHLCRPLAQFEELVS
jgi:hypothetical protein